MYRRLRFHPALEPPEDLTRPTLARVSLLAGTLSPTGSPSAGNASGQYLLIRTYRDDPGPGASSI